MNTPTHLPQNGKVHSNVYRTEKFKLTFSLVFFCCLKEIMNSGACGSNGGNGGRDDKDGKTPEQRHREFIQEMDDLRRREV